MLASLLFIAGCKKPERVVVVDAGAPPAPVIEKRDVTATQYSLSLFEPNGAKCDWALLDVATSKRSTIASFDGTCVGVHVAWSEDTHHAVVWFRPAFVSGSSYGSQTSSPPGFAEEKVDETAKDRVFQVSVIDGRVKTLSLPAFPSMELQAFGIDTEGHALAFFEQDLTDAEAKKKSITIEGEKIALPKVAEGMPALAHLYRFEGEAWKRVRSVPTTTGWDYAQGASALGEYQLGTRSEELASGNLGGDGADDEEQKALSVLLPKKLKSDDGEWVFVGAGKTRVYVWTVTAEFSYATGLIALLEPPRVLPGLGFTDGDIVSARPNGSMFLVTSADVGSHPRLYELPEGKLRFSSDSARGVTFWPGLAKTESHEE